MEDEWLEELDGVPPLDLRQVATYVISPHPDDETLGAGGLIFLLRAAGVPVTVVAVTDGENAYEGEDGLGIVREREQTDALKILGISEQDTIRLRLTDSGLMERESELRKCLTEIIRPGSQIVAPWTSDFHPDHEICGRISEEIASESNSSLIFYFFWTWHRGLPGDLGGRDLRILPLNEAAFGAKSEALQCHQSQLMRDDGAPILPPYLLEPMKRQFEVYLPR